MTHYKTVNGELLVHGARFGIAASRFNSFITDKLVEGAIDALRRHGVAEADIQLVWVPGAFELPLCVKALAERGSHDGLIALGTVIRGATPHFDYVAGQCASGLARISLDFDIAVGFGVLTVDTVEQAIERAGTKAGNKGIDAALSALEMVNVLKALRSQ